MNVFDPARFFTRKRCARCDLLKATDRFGPDKANRSGLKSYCRECEAAIVQAVVAAWTPEQRAARKEYLRQYGKARRAARCGYQATPGLECEP